LTNIHAEYSSIFPDEYSPRKFAEILLRNIHRGNSSGILLKNMTEKIISIGFRRSWRQSKNTIEKKKNIINTATTTTTNNHATANTTR